MATTLQPTISTLAEFLELPETKPASEFVAGSIEQKPMPQGQHSRLQLKLCNLINDIAEAQQTEKETDLKSVSFFIFTHPKNYLINSISW
jgi:Uma2 family endonuclease